MKKANVKLMYILQNVIYECESKTESCGFPNRLHLFSFDVLAEADRKHLNWEELPIFPYWTAFHGRITRTGYQTGNMAASEYFLVTTLGTAIKKTYGSLMHKKKHFSHIFT